MLTSLIISGLKKCKKNGPLTLLSYWIASKHTQKNTDITDKSKPMLKL